MITINCKLDNNDLYSIVDKEFLDVKMKKVNTGKYVGSEETYNSSFFAIRSLFKAIKSFTRDCGDGDGDKDLMNIIST